MTQSELIAQITATTRKTKVAHLSRILREERFALRDLIDVTFHHDRHIAFRAAWILEHVFLRNPAIDEPDLEYLLSCINNVKNESCQRHYAKILMHITSPKAPPQIKQKIATLALQPIVEQCFDWMIDPGVKVAVKVFAADALFNLRFRYPWIKEELALQVRFLMQSGTAAMQSRGGRLLAALV